jgi:6,7-dimethyl-8-ribityllumazine synthase
MASTGNNVLTKGIPELADAFVVLVKTEWNAHLVDRLEDGCIQVLKAAGVSYKTLVVPGAVELPFAVQRYQNGTSRKADAFVTLGTVIQGGTPHFEYVCQMVSEGVTALNLTLPVPVIFGVLTLNNEQEAIDRTGGVHGHKGEEAAITALKMIALNRSLD